MFTGIVEDVGRVEEVAELDGGRRFRIRTTLPSGALEDGASIAVDGACLTVVGSEVEGTGEDRRSSGREGEAFFEVEAIGTTLSRTIAAGYRKGIGVNLERATAVGDRLEGHLVQGHVDGLATVVGVRKEGIHHLVDLALPASVWRGTILHGSITLNGVSLTVNAMEEPDRCQVAIIPWTWIRTNLGRLEPGDRVNVEGDLIGKYVGRYLESFRLEHGSGRGTSKGDPEGEGR